MYVNYSYSAKVSHNGPRRGTEKMFQAVS